MMRLQKTTERGACRGVTRLYGARGRKQVWHPMFEPEVFGMQMYCIEESTCDTVGTFRHPRSHSASPSVIPPPDSDSVPGELRSLARAGLKGRGPGAIYTGGPL